MIYNYGYFQSIYKYHVLDFFEITSTVYACANAACYKANFFAPVPLLENACIFKVILMVNSTGYNQIEIQINIQILNIIKICSKIHFITIFFILLQSFLSYF